MHITQSQLSELMASIALIILIISSNFLDQLFPCKVQEILKNNIFFKHMISFFILVFYIVSADMIKYNKISPYFIIVSLLIYALFIMLTKTYYIYWFAFVITACLKYLYYLWVIYYYDTLPSDVDKETHPTFIIIDKLLNYALLIILFIGFISYLGYKKLTCGKSFSYWLFFTLPNKCTNELNDSINLHKKTYGLIQLFKSGLFK